MTTRSTGRQRGRPPYPLLTPAEERVLKYVRKGHTNGEIAQLLDVTSDAVKYHVSNMLGKLQLTSREELAEWHERRNPLGRLWAAIPLSAKLGLGRGHGGRGCGWLHRLRSCPCTGCSVVRGTGDHGLRRPARERQFRDAPDFG